jgi:DNA-binding transcriptional LysR family regulator
MRLEDLNYFIAVAEVGRIGLASENLGQSQPAVTKGFQRLERELGFQLFDRTSKGMELTTTGATFLERIVKVRSSFREALKEANDLHLGRLGLVRVGVPTSIMGSLFSDAFAELIKQRPAARVQVTIGLADTLQALVRNGSLDLCITALSHKADPELEPIKLYADELVVVVRDHHPLLALPKVQIADLAAQLWLLPNATVIARRVIDAYFVEAGMPPPNVALETNSSADSLMAVIRKTDLVTIISKRALEQSPKGLRALKIPGTRWARNVGLLRRKGAYQSPLAQRLVEILRKRAGSTASK